MFLTTRFSTLSQSFFGVRKSSQLGNSGVWLSPHAHHLLLRLVIAVSSGFLLSLLVSKFSCNSTS